MKALNKIACTLLMLTSAVVNGQLSPILMTDTNQIVISGEGGFSSNAIPMEFSNKFIFGGFITNEIKDNALDKHNTNNYLGAAGNAEVSYFSKIKDRKIVGESFWGISLGTKTLTFNTYSKDLFGLVFYGNEPYAGTPLNFTGTTFNLQQFHSIGLATGISRTGFAGSNYNFQWSLSPNLLIGMNYLQADINSGKLLTSPTGSQIDTEIQAQYFSSDTAEGNTNPSGYGASLNTQAVLSSEKNTFAVTVSDFGLINWNTELHYDIDTTFYFSGIGIDDVFNIKDSVMDVESFKDTLLHNKATKKTAYLPALISIYFKHQFNDNWNLKNWVQYRTVNNYIPLVMSQINYTKNGFEGGVSAAYGGYANFQTGLTLSYDFKIAKIEIGTSNVLALFDNNQTSLNLFARATYRL